MRKLWILSIICLLLVAGISVCGSNNGGDTAPPVDTFVSTTDNKYESISFTGKLNWDIKPKLVRMIPDGSQQPAHRRPAHPIKDKDLLQKPITNVIILVHGHNEEEKDGNVTPTLRDTQWSYTYKRDVWNALYKTYLADTTLEKRPNNEAECTAFYEFIYPTFLPIFSPIIDNEVKTIKTLDRYLVEALSTGAENDGFQLAKMRKANMSKNMSIVAHSMGGLVARAGIQLFDEAMDKDFQRLVTWGCPHRGSVLVTLSYAVKQKLYELVTDNSTCIGQGNAIWLSRDRLSSQQIDTPGNRDCRWEQTGSNNFLFDCVFRYIGEKPDPTYDFTKGDYLYSSGIYRLNAGDRYPDGEKYTFIYGYAPVYDYFGGISKDTNKGALLNANIIKGTLDANQAVKKEAGGKVIKIAQSDGAVLLSSMIAEGLFPKATRIDVGDIDHEAYFELSAKGEVTAKNTLAALGLIGQPRPRCQCAVVELKNPTDLKGIASGTSLKVEALYKLDAMFDANPGKRIQTAEVITINNATKKESSLGKLTIADNGTLTGNVKTPDAEDYQFFVRVQLKDDTQIESKRLDGSANVITKPSPTVSSPAAILTTAAAGGGWYLEGEPIIEKENAVNDQYRTYSLTVNNGSASGVYTWSDDKCGGTYTGSMTWTLPPAYMQPGSQINFHMTAKTTVQNTCGSRSVGSGGWIKAEGTTIVKAIDETSPSASGAYTVPDGRAGKKLQMWATVGVANLHATVYYNYVYQSTGPGTTPSKQTATPPSAANWSGQWNCGEWGLVTLAQSGNQVTGTYTYQGGKVTATVTGDNGNTLVGTWSEEPTYQPPNDAGDIKFTISADGNSFTGQWRYGSSGDWKPWNGQRGQ